MKSFVSNDMPVIGAARFRAPSSHPKATVAPAPVYHVKTAPTPAPTNNLYVGQVVRGAAVPSNDSELVRANFRGEILEFGNWGQFDVRIKDLSTGKKYKFEKRFLRPA